MASDPQVTQINLMRHQCTDLPSSKNKQRKSFVKPRPPSHKNETSDRQHSYKKSLMPRMYTRTRTDVRSVEIQITLKVSSPAKKFQCRSCHKYGHFTSLWYQKKQASFKHGKPKSHMLQVCAGYACDKSICGHPEDCSSVMIHSVSK